LAGDPGGRNIDDDCRFFVVLALALRESLDARDGLRSERQGPHGGSFVASLLSAFTLALILHGLRAEDLHTGVTLGFHVWLGFVATVQFTGALFAKQSMKLFAINTGYQLVCYLIMGTILTIWR
jgi:hypothetical protein